MSFFQKLWDKFSLLGFKGTICCATSRLYMYIMHRQFGFEEWHATAPFCCRPYKKKVVSIIKSLNSNGVVEIGCGLGDIGRNLQEPNKLHYFGIDQDSKVIDAARYLARNEKLITFKRGSFEDIKTLSSDRFDTLLLLNWPHNIDKKSLVNMITSNLTNNIQYLLIDGIKQQSSGYLYYHYAKELIEEGLPFKVKAIIENIDEVRNLMVFER